jgi:DNA replication and repair protein RecF
VRLLSLSLRDFRNVHEARLEPSERSTVLVGPNGQGKTNLLEALFLLCTLKPLRATRLAELVRFGAERARVEGDFDAPGGVRTVAVEVGPEGRTAFLDGKPLSSSDRLDAFFEGRAAVCFSPDDLLLVKGGPDQRRRFLDRAAFNRWPAVLFEAREYLRALRERNAALRHSAADVEESFREPLVRAGARLVARRVALLAEISPRMAEAFAQISGPEAAVALLAYRPAAGLQVEGASEEQIAARLSAALAHRVARDREKGYTSAGPHMDDLLLSLGGKGARPYGSQGQQRALVLALKIAEIENLRDKLGRPPLLLLDDVSSELDPEKNGHLLRHLAALPGQAVLTTTDRRLLEPAAGEGAVFYRVRDGVFERDFPPVIPGS